MNCISFLLKDINNLTFYLFLIVFFSGNAYGKNYVISSKHDLGGKTITFPTGCKLIFKGDGCYVNGTIKGHNTFIVGGRRAIFDNIVLKGTFVADIAFSEWFNATPDCILDNNSKLVSGTDNTQAFQNLFLFNNISIAKGIYLVKNQLVCRSNQIIEGNNATIKSLNKGNCVRIGKPSITPLINVTFRNVHIVGSKHDYNEKVEHWHGVNIAYAHNITLENVTSEYCRGDGFYIGGSVNKNGDGIIPQNITLKNVIASKNHRQGLSITRVKGCSIINSIFKCTEGTMPQCGIDIEPNYAIKDDGTLFIGECEDIKIQRCKFENNKMHGLYIANFKCSDPSYNNIKNVSVSDCVFMDDDMVVYGCSKALINDVRFINASILIRGKSIIEDLVINNIDMKAKDGYSNNCAIRLEYRKDWPVRRNITISGVNINGYQTAIMADDKSFFGQKIFDGLMVLNCNISNCTDGIEIGNSVKNLTCKDNTFRKKSDKHHK